RFALDALNNVLGGGMSSRLFQQIPDLRVLAYSAYSYTTQYADTGLFAVYAGFAPSKVDDVRALIRDELAKGAADGVTVADVAGGTEMLKGALLLGLEDAVSRMSRLGKSELLYDDMLSVDDLLARIGAIAPDDIRAVAAQVLTNPASLAGIGP